LREGVSFCLIFVRASTSFRHEKRKSATSPLALRANRVRLKFDGYVLDAGRRELLRGAEPTAVEPQVFDFKPQFAARAPRAPAP
jgi:hypothetical protein